MQHIAIDLGGRESQVCIRKGDGTIVQELRWPTDRLKSLLKQHTPSRVSMETCAEAFAVADEARRLGHDVRVVPATLVRALGVGERKVKTDRRDAQKLSEVSCRIELPTVHVRSLRSRELKSMYRSREELVKARTQFINNVRGWLRTKNARVRSGGPTTFTKRIREKALKSPEGLPVFVDRLLLMIDELSGHIKQANAEMAQIAKTDPACRLLMTCPGVGCIVAVRFIAVVDDLSRFPTAHALESYLGLTPGESSSSGRKQRLAITKAGPSDMRKLLVQAAWVVWRQCPTEPMAQWGRQVAERRGQRIAIVAMARKLSGILYAMWRDGRPFDGSRLKRDAARIASETA